MYMIVNNFSEPKKFVPLYIKIVYRYDYTCFEAVNRYDSFRKTGFGDAISFLSCSPHRICHAHPIGSSRQNSNIFLFAIILCKAKGKNRLCQIFGEIDRF